MKNILHSAAFHPRFVEVKFFSTFLKPLRRHSLRRHIGEDSTSAWIRRRLSMHHSIISGNCRILH